MDPAEAEVKTILDMKDFLGEQLKEEKHFRTQDGGSIPIIKLDKITLCFSKESHELILDPLCKILYLYQASSDAHSNRWQVSESADGRSRLSQEYARPHIAFRDEPHG